MDRFWRKSEDKGFTGWACDEDTITRHWNELVAIGKELLRISNE